ncbi:hypothetical protein [Pseudomonas phage vB_Pa-PAC2]
MMLWLKQSFYKSFSIDSVWLKVETPTSIDYSFC